MAFFMPLSLFVTNATMIAIVVNWFIEGDYRQKLARLMGHKEIFVFCALYIVHIIWLANTSNFDYAMNDLRVKLPLFALPLALGSSKPISFKNLNLVLLAFVSGVFVATCLGAVAKFCGLESDYRALALFVSSIRLSIMTCMSIFVLLYFVHKKIFFTKWTMWIALLLCIWLLFFMSMIQSMTGYVCFFVVLESIMVAIAIKSKQKLYKRTGLVLAVVIPLTITSFITYSIYDFYRPTQDNVQLEKTANGNPYDVIESDGTLENGNVVWMNVSKKELGQAWNTRSQIPIDSLDRKGQYIYPTMVRYMASLGLTKDAAGVDKLSDDDVLNIENGETNYRFARSGGLICRVYVIIWEFDVFHKTGNCNGHSVTQRIEYLKYGAKLAWKNFFTGTGVGDVDDEYQAIYEEENTNINQEWRNRAHNQFLTFLVAFGLFGFLICLFAWFYPVFSSVRSCSYYFGIFFIIATVSMFSDDTLETSTGAVFVAFFYSLLKWTIDERFENREKQ